MVQKVSLSPPFGSLLHSQLDLHGHTTFTARNLKFCPGSQHFLANQRGPTSCHTCGFLDSNSQFPRILCIHRDEASKSLSRDNALSRPECQYLFVFYAEVSRPAFGREVGGKVRGYMEIRRAPYAHHFRASQPRLDPHPPTTRAPQSSTLFLSEMIAASPPPHHHPPADFMWPAHELWTSLVASTCTLGHIHQSLPPLGSRKSCDKD